MDRYLREHFDYNVRVMLDNNFWQPFHLPLTQDNNEEQLTRVVSVTMGTLYPQYIDLARIRRVDLEAFSENWIQERSTSFEKVEKPALMRGYFDPFIGNSWEQVGEHYTCKVLAYRTFTLFIRVASKVPPLPASGLRVSLRVVHDILTSCLDAFPDSDEMPVCDGEWSPAIGSGGDRAWWRVGTTKKRDMEIMIQLTSRVITARAQKQQEIRRYIFAALKRLHKPEGGADNEAAAENNRRLSNAYSLLKIDENMSLGLPSDYELPDGYIGHDIGELVQFYQHSMAASRALNPFPILFCARDTDYPYSSSN